MAEFEKKHHGSSEFNQGNKYVANDGVQPATINNAVENSLYDYAFIQALTETPDVSEANSPGTLSVTLIDNPGNAQGISGAKKFKFSHLKGATGATPNFSIGTITAGTSATDANVTITGTPENPILNFTVPRGRSISSITAGTPTSTNTQTTTPITVNYDDGTNSSFDVVSARGLKGDPVWVRYATNSAGSGMTATPSSSTKYIGFYVGSAASTTASDYTWSRYVGKEPAAISIGVSDDAVPSPEVTVEWDDGSSPTVVPVDTSDCYTTEPVNGIVTSVNGMDGAVDIGNISTIFENDKATVKEATRAKCVKAENILITPFAYGQNPTISAGLDFITNKYIFVFRKYHADSAGDSFDWYVASPNVSAGTTSSEGIYDANYYYLMFSIPTYVSVPITYIYTRLRYIKSTGALMWLDAHEVTYSTTGTGITSKDIEDETWQLYAISKVLTSK